MAKNRTASQMFGNVNFQKIPTSVHNLSCDRFWTCNPGPVRPVWYQEVLPRDKWRIYPEFAIESFPTALPMYGSYEARVDYFFEPLSNMYGWYDNNALMTFEAFKNAPRWQLNLPQAGSSLWKDGATEFPSPTDIHIPGCGSLYDHLGFPTVAQQVFSTTPTNANGETASLPSNPMGGIASHGENFLAFWDIYRNFYLNPQEGTFPVIIVGAKSSVNATKNMYTSFNTYVLDDLMMKVRCVSGKANTTRSAYLSNTLNNLANPVHCSALFGAPSISDSDGYLTTFLNTLSSYYTYYDNSLPLCTYKMDFFRGRVNSSAIYESQVDSSGGNITINNIRFANKAQKLADLFSITSGRISDWIRTLWNSSLPDTDVPIYLGGFGTTISFDTTMQTSASQTNGTPLGWQAATAAGSGKGRAITFKAKGYGVIMAIFTLRPNVVYGQMRWPLDVRTAWIDKFTPQMANLGYLPLSRAWYNPFRTMDTPIPEGSIGNRLAWVEYMTDVDRCFGEFRYPYSLSAFLPQTIPSYTYDPEMLPLDDLADASVSTYVFPDAWNRFFSNYLGGVHNFRAKLSQNIKCTRAIPYRTQPSL